MLQSLGRDHSTPRCEARSANSSGSTARAQDPVLGAGDAQGAALRGWNADPTTAAVAPAAARFSRWCSALVRSLTSQKSVPAPSDESKDATEGIVSQSRTDPKEVSGSVHEPCDGVTNCIAAAIGFLLCGPIASGWGPALVALAWEALSR